MSEAQPQPDQFDPENVAGLDPEIIEAVVAALDEADTEKAKTLAISLHWSDLADLLETLNHDRRENLVEAIAAEFPANVLTELDESVRERVIEQLGLSHVANVVSDLEADDVIEIVEELDSAEREEVLDALSDDDRSMVEEGLSYPEDSAGRLMQRSVVDMPSHWSVGQAIDFLREADDLPRDFYDIFLVDPNQRPLGAIPLSRILATRRHVALNALMIADLKLIPVDMDQEEVAYLFRQRDLISAPVIDDTRRLVGVITVDDIVDVIHEEHEEDIMRLGGVGEEDDLFAAVLDTARSRFIWLLVHLAAAILGAAVINHFSGTIEQMVAMAVLMPIVAAMGGTASVQTLTVAVRAIAMRELTPANALRTIGKEIVVGMVNGLLFAVIIGGVAWGWFGNPALGGVIALAIVINFLVAGLAGSALPVYLQRFGFDPAVASSALLTSITDVLGFYVFLALGTWLLL
ncbi:MAG: magnesium transporter [Rhodospirillaceae bacterium]|nr:magnesium transporter [Rhodospirillaceae bacterium]MBT4747880.1 magnesium transporter [Rhodospirillaceae bacterium]MBT5179333.1 magnesium transporter [Rhodospirillaceae bacterium]MBT5838331.1 magnesium transporter [Rhodospirillaceae bacterium]MBT6292591.1 magnesium transporter [Rhodospirillaceae bacterium]